MRTVQQKAGLRYSLPYSFQILRVHQKSDIAALSFPYFSGETQSESDAAVLSYIFPLLF